MKTEKSPEGLEIRCVFTFEKPVVFSGGDRQHCQELGKQQVPGILSGKQKVMG